MSATLEAPPATPEPARVAVAWWEVEYAPLDRSSPWRLIAGSTLECFARDAYHIILMTMDGGNVRLVRRDGRAHPRVIEYATWRWTRTPPAARPWEYRRGRRPRTPRAH